MKRFRLLALPTAALIATATLLPALPAAAATSTDGCNTSVTLPSRIRINYVNMFEYPTLASDCAIGLASYTIVRADGVLSQSMLWDSSNPNPMWTLSSNTGPGRYQAVQGSAADVNGNTVEAPDSNVSVAKYDSQLSWRSAHRAGRYVTLREDVKRFSYSGGRYADSGGGYVSWRGAVVHFQERVDGHWHRVRTVRSSGTGIASARIKSGRQTWRALVDDSGATWGGQSGSHRA